MNPRRLGLCFLLILSAGLLAAQPTNVTTWRNDNRRDGLNSTETKLTQATVTKSSFGKICSTKPGDIDGQIYAQPLEVSGAIPGHLHVVYVATMNDSVYFIDGANDDCNVIRHISLLKPGEEAVACHDVEASCATVNPIVGILGTPVIDTSTNTMYLVSWSELTTGACATKKGSACFVHRLHALDIITGAEKFGGPVAIPSITVGKNQFTSYNHLQRTGLLLLPKVANNGDSGIYVGFSEMDGGGIVGQSVPNGWMYRFDAQDLEAAPLLWAVTPNGEGGGLWMSGAGIAAGTDKPGGDEYIYVATGDGNFDAENGGSDYGDSVVKLTTDLKVAGYFSPYRQYCDDIEDKDLGSGGVLLIPAGIGSSKINFSVASGKDGNIYVLDRAILGGYSGPASNTCPPPPPGPNFNYQTFQGSENEYYSAPAYWNGNLYSVANNSPLARYQISGTACTPAPVCQTPLASTTEKFSYGPVPVVSSNGNETGTALLWIIRGNGWPSSNSNIHPAQAVLYGYDAEHVGLPLLMPELWNSAQCPSRDGAGNATKFVVPTVANGRVFIGTMDPTDPTHTKGRLDVYGATSVPCS